MTCEEDSVCALDVQKAKNGEMPVTGVVELIQLLLAQDQQGELALEAAIAAAEKKLEQITALLTQAEVYKTAESALANRTAEEAALAAELATAATALNTAQANVPAQEKLQSKITEMRVQLSSYDELENYLAALSSAKKDLANAQAAKEKAAKDKESLTAEMAALRVEQKDLANIGAEMEKLTARRQQQEERKMQFADFLSGVEGLARERVKYRKKQENYLKAEEIASQLLREYEAKDCAFLREQAGIMASGLIAGAPCPVCGATEHPLPAILAENAPTEADVKEAKAKYDRAQGEKNKAGSEAQKQKGIVETTEEVLAKEIDSLIPEITLEDGTKVAEEQEAMLAEQIEKLDTQITELEKKEKRKNELDTVLPKKEQQLSETEKTLASVTAEIAALEEKVNSSEVRINALRGKLAFPDKAAAEAEIASLQAEADRLHKNLKAAETAYNQCKERLAGVRGTIAQLRKQLEDGTDIDAEQLQEEKNGYTAQKSAATAKQKAVHARISANQNALDGISRKAAEMEKLDNKYAWMKALSDTANGTVYGKDKMMLETYIQATYFERILARANIRLQKMSGGQYDLKRRVEADNKKSQSGLELDIIDHINATERSVNTLSGGEAFLASLALALGLSDEVQMSTGIRLDTLFVDEGFGSLDSDALGKAYSTLAGLTEGNRLVGIISHVAELKEKIDKQIVVKKEKTGESRAEIRI